jgi:hypothetical protein
MTRLLCGPTTIPDLVLLLSLLPLVGVGGILGWAFRKRSASSSAPSPQPVPPPADNQERRQSPRRTVTPVFVRIRGTGAAEAQQQEGLVLDVSAEGIGLSLKQPVAVGTVLEVRVATASPSIPWTSVEVRSAATLSCRWKVGCRFVQEPPPQVRVLFG